MTTLGDLFWLVSLFLLPSNLYPIKVNAGTRGLLTVVAVASNIGF